MILTTCKYFDLVGNRCSRVTDGKCNNLQDCEFKYIAELKKEISTLQGKLDAYQMSEQEATEIIAELKTENDRLREEVETRDNLVEHFRKEAINWAKISNDCIKDIEKYKQTLQEIKAIAEDAYENESEYQATGVYNEIIQKITKAEEE